MSERHPNTLPALRPNLSVPSTGPWVRIHQCPLTAKYPDDQSVYIDPAVAIAGQAVDICYDGQPLANGDALQGHWGIDGWQTVTDTPMAKRADGTWWATVIPACNAARLDYVFTDGRGTWDNHNGADWRQNLAASSTCSLVKVNFRVDNAYTVWGQHIYVIGDLHELGHWDTDRAVTMTPCTIPVGAPPSGYRPTLPCSSNSSGVTP